MAKASAHVPPSSPDDWVTLAQRELSNLAGAYQGKLSNDARVEHALRAVEAALKACLWKNHKWESWPPRQKGFKFLYSHHLEAMLDNCGTFRSQLRLSDEHWASWSVLVNVIEKQSRYSTELPSDAETNEVARSARHPDKGVVPWLLARYREMI